MIDLVELGESRLLNLLFRPSGRIMESRLRARLFDPRKTLRAARLAPGQTVLEVGCGTGFFTRIAAEMIGESGHLIAMDLLSGYVDRVRQKVRDAGLSNVEVIRRDALKSGLDTGTVDVALLLGVVPFPTLPLRRLLPEMHRVLKLDGLLAVWLFPVPGVVPAAIRRSGLFTELGKQAGVYTYRKRGAAARGPAEPTRLGRRQRSLREAPSERHRLRLPLT